MTTLISTEGSVTSNKRLLMQSTLFSDGPELMKFFETTKDEFIKQTDDVSTANHLNGQSL